MPNDERLNSLTDEQLEIRLIYSAYFLEREEFREYYLKSKKAESVDYIDFEDIGYTKAEIDEIKKEVSS